MSLPPTPDTSPAPRRIQRHRTKGWRMPEGAVYVGRPGRWGNPYFLGRFGNMVRWEGWFVADLADVHVHYGQHRTEVEARRHAVDLYALHVGPMGNHELDVVEVQRELAGKDLVCWCPLDVPCHADVLLEIANGGAS